MKKIDLSDKAITRRLRRTDELRRLSLSLMKAKKENTERKPTKVKLQNKKTT